MRERDEPKNTALRITNQFRSGGGMAYDLKCEGVRLTLLIWLRGSAWLAALVDSVTRFAVACAGRDMPSSSPQ